MILILLASCAGPFEPAGDAANAPELALATQQIEPTATRQPTAIPTLPPTATLVPTATSAPPTPTRTRAPIPVPATATPTTPPMVDPATTSAAVSQISLPADDAPHNMLTEWWYYNGQLTADDGPEYGFHSIIFQLRRQNGSTTR